MVTIKSNQFPRQEEKPIKEKNPELSIKQKADFIFRNIEDKMPKLFELITKT